MKISDIRTKICGITRPKDIDVAEEFGAAYLGFVFFHKSPRNLNLEKARALAGRVSPGVVKTALVVNASDADIQKILDAVPIDMLQLHGLETPERVHDVKARFGLPVMKAIGIETEADLSKITEFAQSADQLLIDAKPPKGAPLPGGNGNAFDWDLLAGLRWPVPWMLAGGLNPGNVKDAVERTGARQVDVSSGVEHWPGFKDSTRIEKFLRAVNPVEAPSTTT